MFREQFTDRGVRLLDIVGIQMTAVTLLPPVYVRIGALDKPTPKS